MGERLAKSLTLYDNGQEEPFGQRKNQSTSAIRSGARMSLDLNRDEDLKPGIKLDARRTSMEFLPQRASIFKNNSGHKTESMKNLEPHKFDPMARTQIQFGSLKPNADFGSITIDSRPLIPQKKKPFVPNDYGNKRQPATSEQQAVQTKV